MVRRRPIGWLVLASMAVACSSPKLSPEETLPAPVCRGDLPVERLAPGPIADLTADGAEVYWTGESSVWKLRGDETSPVLLASFEGPARHIALDAGHVYVTHGVDGAATLSRAPRDGGALERLAGGAGEPAQPDLVVVEANRIVFSSLDGTLWRLGKVAFDGVAQTFGDKLGPGPIWGLASSRVGLAVAMGAPGQGRVWLDQTSSTDMHSDDEARRLVTSLQSAGALALAPSGWTLVASSSGTLRQVGQPLLGTRGDLALEDDPGSPWRALTTDGEQVYAHDGRSVTMRRLGGGPATQFGCGDDLRGLALGDGAIYWVDAQHGLTRAPAPWSTAQRERPWGGKYRWVELNVRALIDLQSDAQIAGDSIWWFHIKESAPGRAQEKNEPTYLNGQPWMPTWPDHWLGSLNQDCVCSSSASTGWPRVPRTRQDPYVVKNAGRGEVRSSQVHGPDFKIVMTFEDPASGSEWYDATIGYWAEDDDQP